MLGFSTSDVVEPLPDPSEMTLKNIQQELKSKNVSSADCFDRDSLTKRLVEARANPSTPIKSTEDAPPVSASASASATADSSPSPSQSSTKATNTPDASDFDRDKTLAELRTMRIKELKVELSKYKVRWGTMIEKEDMVQALCNAMAEKSEQTRNFSRSGKVLPGDVSEVDEEILLKELGWLESDLSRGVMTTARDDNPKASPPILLDVFATWCGPCQFLVPHLKGAAEELGTDVRVMKIDSDKYQRLASVLKVGGLPTIILFDGNNVSKEVDRVEGALTKDGIVSFVKRHF